MPLYDLTCEEHGFQDDVYFSSVVAGDYAPCPVCEVPARKDLAPINPIGVIFSNAIELPSAGLRLESNKEVRDYQKKNPTHNFVSTSSARFKKTKDCLHERREAKVTKLGYKSFDHYRVEKRQERASERKEAASAPPKKASAAAK